MTPPDLINTKLFITNNLYFYYDLGPVTSVIISYETYSYFIVVNNLVHLSVTF